MFRNWLAYWFLIGVTVNALRYFIMMAKYDAVILREPNSVVLAGEITTCVVIIALGIERVVHQIKEGNKHGNK